jgi:hypothetical protein
MSFVDGLQKVADMDHNNQGLEFNTASTPPYDAGAAFLANTGIPKYQPQGDGNVFSSGKKKPKKGEDLVAINVALSKYALDDSGPSAEMGGNQSGQGASTLATQLKYETSTPGINPETYGWDPTSKTRLSRYLKASGERTKHVHKRNR